MIDTNLFRSTPYWDDYDPEKEYTAILAVPGRVEQAREFTQSQTILRDHLGRLGESIYKEGAIVEGCSLEVFPNEGYVKLREGRIFLKGLIRIVKEINLPCTFVGDEYVVAKIKSSVITEAEDTSLRDPAQGYENYGQYGSHRLKESVQVFIANGTNDIDGVPLYTLSDGNVVNDSSETSEDLKFMNVLAKRTFDLSGNYKIHGLNLMARKDGAVDENGNILVSVTEGRAYVAGYEVAKNCVSNVKVRPAEEFRTTSGEVEYYLEGTSRYALTHPYVKQITTLVAPVRVTGEQKERGLAQGKDTLLKQPVTLIEQVYTSGSQSYTYQQGDIYDYIREGDSVSWSPAGKEPSTGSTYYVTYIYNAVLTEGVDFEVVRENGVSYIQFLPGGLKPVHNMQFQVHYEYYLSRRDVVLLNHDGSFQIIEGEPEIPERLITPYNLSDHSLALGVVEITPDSTTVTVLNYKSERLTQAQLYNLVMRLDNLEYNIAMTNLDSEAAEGEDATLLKGVYTDGFLGYSKCNLTTPEFTAAINTSSNELTTHVTDVPHNLTVSVANTTAVLNGRVYTAPSTEKLALSQPIATKARMVNEYSVYDKFAIIKVTPDVDRWVDTENLYVYETANPTNQTSMRYETISRSQNTSSSSLGGTTSSSYADTNWGSFFGTPTDTNSTTLSSFVEHMRVRTVTVEGSAFLANSDNITGYFNGVKVALTPINGSVKGTLAGTVKSNASGTFTATFSIPKGVPCGTVEVLMECSTASGVAPYTAMGILNTITHTTTKQVHTITQVLRTTTQIHYNYVRPYNPDPIAQSFTFDKDTTLTKVGLFFENKDKSRPVVVQIKGISNGYPNGEVYSSVDVFPSKINASGDASAETLVTLSPPVQCIAGESYAVTIMSDVDTYTMWAGAVSENNIATGAPVPMNPYNRGVLFTSSNNDTWTAHQGEDLKFNLYKASYTGTGTITYEALNISGITEFTILNDYVDDNNIGVRWYYRTVAGGTMYPADVNRAISLSKDQAGNILQIYCIMQYTENASPMVSNDSPMVVYSIRNQKGTYISRGITLSQPYEKVKIYFEALDLNRYGSIKVSYKHNPDGAWTVLTTTNAKFTDLGYVSSTEYFKDYLWEANLPADVIQKGGATFYSVRLELTCNDVYTPLRVRKLRNVLSEA